MSPNNRRRLALASKNLPALNELRKNVKKEKREALKRHLNVMYTRSKNQGSLLLKKRTKRLSRGVNKEGWGHVTPYSPYLNVYRWLNVMKKVPVTSKSRLTNNNINQLKKNILRKMKPVKIGEEMFVSMAGKRFSTNNGKTILYINKPGREYDENAPLLKMYVKKMQNNPQQVALYRIIPKNNSSLKNHITYVPVMNYHNKNNVNTLGFVNK